MSEKKTLCAALPELPSPEFFSDPQHTIVTADGRALLSYDPRTRAGFIYSIANRNWSISAPLEFSVFAGLVKMAGYEVTDSHDARVWLASCMDSNAKRTTH